MTFTNQFDKELSSLAFSDSALNFMHEEVGALGTPDQTLEHSLMLHILELAKGGQHLDADPFLVDLLSLRLRKPPRIYHPAQVTYYKGIVSFVCTFHTYNSIK